MPNLTMTIDEDLLRKTRKLAVERNTTVTALVREYLRRLAAKEEESVEQVIHQRSRCFNDRGTVVGNRTWKREDLHER